MEIAKVDIIIVTYNAKERLERCLQSLQRHTRVFDYQLSVVNNKSTDGTSEYLEGHNGEINVINNKKNLGFPKAANIGVKNTSNKYIVLLDDDAEVTQGWLDGLYNQIENRPNVGIVGCKTLSSDKRIFYASIFIANKMIKSTGHDEIDKGQRDYTREADAVNGACWLMRRKLIKQVGYFDERFFPSQYEDLDYCLRTRLAGYKIIYNGKVKIIHHHLFRDGGTAQNRKNWRKFMKKWKNKLHKFPLKDSHAIDKYIASGLCYLENKRFKQALTEFKKVELIDKRFSEPLYMGIALEGMGKYNDAIKEVKKALSLNPLNFYPHYYLALIYKKIGQIKEANGESVKTFSFISSNKKFLSYIPEQTQKIATGESIAMSI